MKASNSLWWVIPLIISTGAIISGCDEKDNDEKEILDSQHVVTEKQGQTANDVVLTDVTTQQRAANNENSEGYNLVAYRGDELLVTYIPEEHFFQAHKVKMTVNFFDEYSCDSQEAPYMASYVIGEKAELGKIYNVMLSGTFDDGTCKLSESREFKVLVDIDPQNSAQIPFIVNASQDLLNFVTAELTYTDGYGHTHVIALSDEDWNKPDSISAYTYRREDGSEFIVFEGEEIDPSWTFVEESRFLPDADYKFTQQYPLGSECHVSIRYSRKPSAQIQDRKYYFSHYVDRGKASINARNRIVIDNYFSIHIIAAQYASSQVEEYISNLVNTTDELSLAIDKNGHITNMH